MTVHCVNCESDNLMQGITGDIICQNCKTFMGIYDKSKKIAVPRQTMEQKPNLFK